MRQSGKINQTKKKNTGQIRLWPLALLLVLLLVIIGVQTLAEGNTGWRQLLGFSSDASTTEAQPGESETASTDPTSSLPGSATETTTAAPTATPGPEQEIRATITAVGDIILHQAVIDGGLVSGQGKTAQYDYTPIFQYVKPIFSASSISLANYEGTLAGYPYSGYPFFCAPDAIADALAKAGIDVATTANNHTIDKGLAGVIRTAQVFRDQGFTVVGTRPDETSPADAVVDAGGIKVGLMAYTFETSGTASQKSLNGIPMPAAADPLIDSFNPYRSDAMARDMAAMLQRASVLREQGAELICLSLHWGNEYQTRSCTYQRQMAQQLADAGIELIIGHHPHVLEEIDVLTSAKTGKPTLVYYSISNFLHNMDFSTHGTSGKAQDGVIARITLVKDSEGVHVEQGEYIPTYVVRVPKGNEVQHLIVPVLPALDNPDGYQTTNKEMSASLKRITAILDDSKGNSTIPVKQSAR